MRMLTSLGGTMMALPGDAVAVKMPVMSVGLLVARVPSAECHEDEDYDKCSVLLPGRMRLLRYRGRDVSRLHCSGENDESVCVTPQGRLDL